MTVTLSRALSGSVVASLLAGCASKLPGYLPDRPREESRLGRAVSVREQFEGGTGSWEVPPARHLADPSYFFLGIGVFEALEGVGNVFATARHDVALPTR